MSAALDGRRDIEFFQLVRLLQRARPDADPVGRADEPAREAVRFGSSTDFAFAASDVSAVEAGDDDAPARVEVRFMGVASPDSFGSLPSAYADEINRQLADHNPALRDFFDLFNHRVISLFYRAWERGRLDITCERGTDNAFERVLRGVLGLEGPGLGDRLPIPARELLGRAGLLAMRPVPPLALESAIESLFGLAAEVQSFMPAWFPIEPGDRTRLGVHNSSLGSDPDAPEAGEEVVLGGEVSLCESRFRLRLGPMDRARFESLLPGSEGFAALVGLVRLAVGSELDFDVQLLLDGERLPDLRLGTEHEAPTRLGHTSWLGGRPEGMAIADEAIFHGSLSDRLAGPGGPPA